MTRAIISLNAGSSSIKFALYKLAEDGPRHAAAGKLEGIGTAPHLIVRNEAGELLAERRWDDGAALTHEALLADLFQWAHAHLPHHDIVGVGHRVVHGGDRFVAPVRVDAGVIEALDVLCPLAPLHQPHNLAAIRAISALAPGLPQVACFDTAFHHTMPVVATRLALPRALTDKGIRRYGFHGLSYEYIALRLAEIEPAMAGRRVLVAHLGNGASICAMRGGRCVDTSMGFTALDGLMMGTRCGTLDPGAVLYLMQQQGMSAAEIEALLYEQSGLLGVSGVSSDMRALHDSGDPRAAEAIELFVWRAAREAGALIASLGGIDGMVFTGGIGENDPLVRAAICKRLEWAGIDLDEKANATGEPQASKPGSEVWVRVIPTDEERMLALHTLQLLEGTKICPA